MGDALIMPAEPFEEMVLQARDADRKRYGAALARVRGPMPYGKTSSEEEQDRLWAYMEPSLADPARFAMLTTPKEQGGMGMTKLAASYARYPHRRLLVEGAGEGIEAQVKYADHRRKRFLERQARMGTNPAAPEIAPAQPPAPDASILPTLEPPVPEMPTPAAPPVNGTAGRY